MNAKLSEKCFWTFGGAVNSFLLALIIGAVITITAPMVVWSPDTI